jgi:hypothetical protein
VQNPLPVCNAARSLAAPAFHEMAVTLAAYGFAAACFLLMRKITVTRSYKTLTGQGFQPIAQSKKNTFKILILLKTV